MDIASNSQARLFFAMVMAFLCLQKLTADDLNVPQIRPHVGNVISLSSITTSCRPLGIGAEPDLRLTGTSLRNPKLPPCSRPLVASLPRLLSTFLIGLEPTKHADAANSTNSVSHCFHSARLCHRNAATCVVARRLTVLFTDFLDGS